MTDEKRTGKDLVEHWAWAAEKGLMPRTSAKAMAVSCRRVLEVEQDWKNVNVLALDMDEFARRFKNLRALDYKPSTLGDYASRFRRGVLSYRAFLDDPSKWHFGSRTKRTTSSKPKSRQPDDSDTAERSDLQEVALQEYVYPFRQNVLATLTIPKDATAAEIRRLVAWAQTLAVDYEGV